MAERVDRNLWNTDGFFGGCCVASTFEHKVHPYGVYFCCNFVEIGLL
jgi:hypothetical protein